MIKKSESLISYILFCIIIVLIAFSPAAKAGAIKGINLCENIIIPSLLPILILSNTIITMKSKSAVKSAVLLGLISGYPSGAALTRELYRNGHITSKQAERIMSYNFCGGCAFIISAVGGIIYKNIKAGIILYLSCVISSLIIAFVTKPFYKSKEQICNKNTTRKKAFTTVLCESVEKSAKSLAVMSAYIILFSALMAVITIPDFIVPIIEITNGLCTSKALPPLPFCAFFLSFGGLCVHFQLFSFLTEMKINYSVFLLFRITAAVLSFLICKIIICFIPESALTSASLTPSLPFELSGLGTGLSSVMIIGCAVIIFDIENRKIQLNK